MLQLAHALREGPEELQDYHPFVTQFDDVTSVKIKCTPAFLSLFMRRTRIGALVQPVGNHRFVDLPTVLLHGNKEVPSMIETLSGKYKNGEEIEKKHQFQYCLAFKFFVYGFKIMEETNTLFPERYSEGDAHPKSDFNTRKPTVQSIHKVRDYGMEEGSLIVDSVGVRATNAEEFEMLLTLFNMKRKEGKKGKCVEVEEVAGFFNHFSVYDLHGWKGLCRMLEDHQIPIEPFQQLYDIMEVRRNLSLLIQHCNVHVALSDGQQRMKPVKDFSDGFFHFDKALPEPQSNSAEERLKYNKLFEERGTNCEMFKKLEMNVLAVDNDEEWTHQTMFKFREVGLQKQKASHEGVSKSYASFVAEIARKMKSHHEYKPVTFENYLISSRNKLDEETMQNINKILMYAFQQVLKHSKNIEIKLGDMLPGTNESIWRTQVEDRLSNTSGFGRMTQKGGKPFPPMHPILAGMMEVIRSASLTDETLQLLDDFATKESFFYQQESKKLPNNIDSTWYCNPHWLYHGLAVTVTVASVEFYEMLEEEPKVYLKDYDFKISSQNKKRLKHLPRTLVLEDILRTFSIYGPNPNLDGANPLVRQYLR